MTGRAFTCPACGMTSRHPTDADQGYCGNCHDWTGPRPARTPAGGADPLEQASDAARAARVLASLGDPNGPAPGDEEAAQVRRAYTAAAAGTITVPPYTVAAGEGGRFTARPMGGALTPVQAAAVLGDVQRRCRSGLADPGTDPFADIRTDPWVGPLPAQLLAGFAGEQAPAGGGPAFDQGGSLQAGQPPAPPARMPEAVLTPAPAPGRVRPAANPARRHLAKRRWLALRGHAPRRTLELPELADLPIPARVPGDQPAQAPREHSTTFLPLWAPDGTLITGTRKQILAEAERLLASRRERRVGLATFYRDGVRITVSTVFEPVDVGAFEDGVPALWETLVFQTSPQARDWIGVESHRWLYCSRWAALAGHRRVVAALAGSGRARRSAHPVRPVRVFESVRA